MRFGRVLGICVTCCLVAGCEEYSRNEYVAKEPRKDLDIELVKALNNIGLENAVVAQHTLYPYHFVANGDGLNDLGRRDLGVLASHFKEHPGPLTIRQGDTPAELYERRVAYVSGHLKQAGVEVSRVALSDGMPGGTGMPSSRVVIIIKEETEELMPATSGVQGMTAR